MAIEVPVKERILEDVLTTVRGIREDDGYSCTVQQAERWKVSPLDKNLAVVAAIYNLTDRRVGNPAGNGREERLMTVATELIFRPTKFGKDFPTRIIYAEADLYRAMTADRGRGAGLAPQGVPQGNAINTVYGNSNTQAWALPNEEIAVSVIIEWAISYRFLAGQPHMG